MEIERNVVGAWSRPAGCGRAGEGRRLLSALAASWPRSRQSCAFSMRAPSISSTIFSSAPGAISTTPTVSPSRSTVARWQSAEISSSRCEMKMTDRPVWLCRRTTSMTLSARFAGSAAVISSSRSTSGSIASARARSSTRRIASGMRRAVSRRSRSATPSSRTQLRKDETGVCVSRRLDCDVEVGDQRRLLVDRDQSGAARLGRRMHRARFAADQDPPGVRPDGPGQDLHQRRLAGAVGAHQGVDFAGTHGQRRVAERRHGAVPLHDAGGFQQQCASTRT